MMSKPTHYVKRIRKIVEVLEQTPFLLSTKLKKGRQGPGLCGVLGLGFPYGSPSHCVNLSKQITGYVPRQLCGRLTLGASSTVH